MQRARAADRPALGPLGEQIEKLLAELEEEAPVDLDDAEQRFQQRIQAITLLLKEYREQQEEHLQRTEPAASGEEAQETLPQETAPQPARQASRARKPRIQRQGKGKGKAKAKGRAARKGTGRLTAKAGGKGTAKGNPRGRTKGRASPKVKPRAQGLQPARGLRPARGPSKSQARRASSAPRKPKGRPRAGRGA